MNDFALALSLAVLGGGFLLIMFLNRFNGGPRG